MSDFTEVVPGYGNRLKQWLPAHWRVRDTGGDLDALLAVYGELLDALHATVVQRLDDSFPDADHGRRCQDWLVPYFAQLLDVQLVSPDADGRRAEVAQAVSWRQRKGTQVSIERIAEEVGQFEVEIQEGWKRVAMTPRIDRHLLPATAYGEEPLTGPATPSLRARHPGLPAITPDVRSCSRAVQCPANNPAASETVFPGDAVPLAWRQIHRHGVPSAPDSYQDVSRRTVDLRTPTSRRGLHHPRRMLLHIPPPEGFFRRIHTTVQWTTLEPLVTEALDAATKTGWKQGETIECVNPELQVAFTVGRSVWNGISLPLIGLRGLTDGPLRVRGVITLDTPAVYRFDNLWLDNRVEISHGMVQLLGCAFRQLLVSTAEREVPVLDARSCLFKKIEAPRGLVRLEYVTVTDTLLAECLQASDSILVPKLRKDRVDADVPAAGCIRFSRLFHLPEKPVPTDPFDPQEPLIDNDPLWRAQNKRSLLRCFAETCTTAVPLFWEEVFGSPGCGVLHPDCNQAIQAGAEDGGEIGAYHEHRYVLRRLAVLEKLQEFLPVGMEAVLITDPSLACAPPKAITT